MILGAIIAVVTVAAVDHQPARIELTVTAPVVSYQADAVLALPAPPCGTPEAQKAQMCVRWTVAPTTDWVRDPSSPEVSCSWDQRRCKLEPPPKRP